MVRVKPYPEIYPFFLRQHYKSKYSNHYNTTHQIHTVMDFHFTIKTLKVWYSLQVLVGTDKEREEHPELNNATYSLETIWDAETLTKPDGYEVTYQGHTDQFDYKYTSDMLNNAIKRYKARYGYFYIEGVKHDSTETERVYTYRKTT